MVDIGEKLRSLRLMRGFTQKDLAGNMLTRNMLSQIERGAALPSFQTVAYLSDRLGIDPGYFFDSAHNFTFYELKKEFPQIRVLCNEKRFEDCLRLAEPYENEDDEELWFVLSHCHYHLALADFEYSRFESASRHLEKSEKYSLRSRYPSAFSERIAFYKKLIAAYRSGERVASSSLMEVIPSKDGYSDFLLYTFLIALIDGNQADKATVIYNTVRINNEFYRSHFNALLAAQLYNYDRAKELLWSIVNSDQFSFSPFLYRVYDDLERYCKATEDYEGAYKCAVAKQKFNRTPEN